jgi:hypothetical protein
MKIQVQLPGQAPAFGQTVRAEVMASSESGSLVMVNGVPVTTDKRLAPGQKLTGKVEQQENGKSTISLEPDTSVSTTHGTPEKWLEANRMPNDPENRALLEVLRKLGMPLSPDLLSKARELFQGLKAELKPADLNALGLILMRNLPKSAFPLLRDYFAGRMTLGAALAKLSPEILAQLRANWSSGNLWDLLAKLSQEKPPTVFGDNPAGQLSQEVTDNLAFQELLSTQPQGKTEGTLYFQWPMFWSGQELPDTLEGEAFYEPDSGDPENRGFSLRLLASPPRLGPMEIGFHRLKQHLWVHFGAEREDSRRALVGMFDGLRPTLENQGWQNIKLTVGTKPHREAFLSPAESEPTSPPPVVPHLDVKA